MLAEPSGHHDRVRSLDRGGPHRSPLDLGPLQAHGYADAYDHVRRVNGYERARLGLELHRRPGGR